MKVVIIGGDAAGLKTAARLRRLDPDAEIHVLEKGNIISYAACGMPYYVSGDIDSFEMLLTTAWGDFKDESYFRDAKDLAIHTGLEAVAIHRDKKVVEAIDEDGTSSEWSYDILVIATGAEPVRLDIPGMNEEGVQFFTRPEDARELRRGLETGSVGRVAVVGTGFIGLEVCEAFGAMWGVEVVLIEKEDQVLPRMLDREMARYVKKHLEDEV